MSPWPLVHLGGGRLEAEKKERAEAARLAILQAEADMLAKVATYPHVRTESMIFRLLIYLDSY